MASVDNANNKIKSQLLEAAFSGRDDKLIKILKSLQKQNNITKISDNLIIECIEYSSKHSNSEIASISSQILSPPITYSKSHRNGHVPKSESPSPPNTGL